MLNAGTSAKRRLEIRNRRTSKRRPIAAEPAGPANRRDSAGSSGAQSTRPMRRQSPPYFPIKSRLRRISVGRAGSRRIALVRCVAGLTAGPRATELFGAPEESYTTGRRFLSAQSCPVAPCKWRFRPISAERAGIAQNKPLRRRPGRSAAPRTAEISRGFLKILHSRPRTQSMRNPALQRQVS